MSSSTATPRVMKSRSAAHKWLFPARIRPNAFSWKSSRVAVERIREAVGEILSVARHDPITAAEGAVRLIERLSPALEHVDSSSGALGGAVNGAIEAMGLKNTQTLATIFDGITRHSPEGLNFKKRAETVGWKEAVRDRDNGTWDWTENRPINPR